MKTKKGFRLRIICGENVVVAEGIENIDFSKIISMNESAAYLWQKVEGLREVTSANVQLVFEPAWDKDMMSEEAKVELGLD